MESTWERPARQTYDEETMSRVKNCSAWWLVWTVLLKLDLLGEDDDIHHTD